MLSGREGRVQSIGFWGGIVAFALLLLVPLPAVVSPAAQRTAACAALMAAWWMSEALPLPATSLLPLLLFPLLRVLSPEQAAAPYANPVIFLFLGGFVLALAMERCGLHRRVALRVIAAAGGGPRRLVLGFMVATAFISMWISNTATTAMMLPIGLALAELLRPKDRVGSFAFGTALMLGIGYSATIGGLGTLIGTPPNAIFAAAARDLAGREIGFFEWMAVGVPVVAVLVPVTWALLVFGFFRPAPLPAAAGELVRAERAHLGTITRAERITLAVFLVTALAWLAREPKLIGALRIPGLTDLAPGIEDSTIAIAGALSLFIIPVNWKRREFAMDWPTAVRLPWGVLLLFGGGLSLARAFESSGLANLIAAGFDDLAGLPVWAVIAIVAALLIFLSELSSNTALAAISMPLLAAAAAGVNQDPVVLMAAGALACSTAFMLPVGTAPSALVFGSGYVRINEMMRIGFWLNLISVGVVTVAAYFLASALLQ